MYAMLNEDIARVLKAVPIESDEKKYFSIMTEFRSTWWPSGAALRLYKAVTWRQVTRSGVLQAIEQLDRLGWNGS